MALEQERDTYKRLLPTMLSDEGKFAVIKGDRLVGVFGTYEDALAEGYRQFKLDPFLVQEISATEEVHFISRLVDACLS